MENCPTLDRNRYSCYNKEKIAPVRTDFVLGCGPDGSMYSTELDGIEYRLEWSRSDGYSLSIIKRR